MGQYVQGTGDVQDIELNDTYSPGSGSTLDFELFDATKISLQEVFTLDESVFSSTDFVRSYSDSIFLNDSDIREAGKQVSEAFSLNDAVSKTPGKAVQEAVSVDDSYSREASFERSYSDVFSLDEVARLTAVVNLFESFSLNEADIRQLGKVVTESFAVDDVYSRSADFFRDVNETVFLDDAVKTVRGQVVTLSETLAFNEFYEYLVAAELAESLGVNELYSRTGTFYRDYSDVLAVNDFRSSTVSKVLEQEILLVATFAELTLNIALFDDLTVNEDATVQVVKALTESVSLNDSLRDLRVFKVLSEDVTLNDADIRSAGKVFTEGFALDSVYSRSSDYFRAVEDAVILDEDLTRFVGSVTEEEVLLVDDTREFFVGKDLVDGLDVRDVFISEADYFRELKDDLEVAEVKDFIQMITRSFDETLDFDGSLTRNVIFPRNLTETLGMNVDLDFFYSEGPGVAPYHVRNKLVESNSVQNAFSKLYSVTLNFGDKEQT